MFKKKKKVAGRGSGAAAAAAAPAGRTAGGKEEEAAPAAPVSQRSEPYEPPKMPTKGQPAEDNTLVMPGDELQQPDGVSEEEDTLGEGTERRGKKLYSTVVGTVRWIDSESGAKVVTVSRYARNFPTPKIGSEILGTVGKVGGGFAAIDIFCVDGRLCNTTFRGDLKTDDTKLVTADIDTGRKIEVWKCVRPGDVVRADVTGYGDRRSYQLSTVREQLGVVYAESTAGHVLRPVDAETMQCEGTNQIESRKVALGGDDLWFMA